MSFQILSHVLKIAIPLLHLGTRLQYRFGIRKTSVSGVGERLSKLSPLIGDSRMLFRVWGKRKPRLQPIIGRLYCNKADPSSLKEFYQSFSGSCPIPSIPLQLREC